MSSITTTTKPLTRRDVYIGLREHFTKPDASYGYSVERAECVYRGVSMDADGFEYHDRFSETRCAVGVCIPDEQYNPNFEEGGVSSLLSSHPEIAALFAEECTWLVERPAPSHLLALPIAYSWLQYVQAIHDYYASTHRPMDEFLAALDQFYASTAAIYS